MREIGQKGGGTVCVILKIIWRRILGINRRGRCARTERGVLSGRLTSQYLVDSTVGSTRQSQVRSRWIDVMWITQARGGASKDSRVEQKRKRQATRR